MSPPPSTSLPTSVSRPLPHHQQHYHTHYLHCPPLSIALYHLCIIHSNFANAAIACLLYPRVRDIPCWPDPNHTGRPARAHWMAQCGVTMSTGGRRGAVRGDASQQLIPRQNPGGYARTADPGATASVQEVQKPSGGGLEVENSRTRSGAPSSPVPTRKRPARYRRVPPPSSRPP